MDAGRVNRVCNAGLVRLILPGIATVIAFALLFYFEHYYNPAHYPIPTR